MFYVILFCAPPRIHIKSNHGHIVCPSERNVLFPRLSRESGLKGMDLDEIWMEGGFEGETEREKGWYNDGMDRRKEGWIDGWILHKCLKTISAKDTQM